MQRDVFYFNKKPNVHARERHAKNIAHARQLATTEHFWIINEFCDYRNFDWEWDFDYLPDEDVWAEDHNNVWPSIHQKDSGTRLCSTESSDLIIYRADVDPLTRKKEKNECWNILAPFDETKFDLSWHPDPSDPPYIYAWGNQHYPVTTTPTLTYTVLGATDFKYMDEIVVLLPSEENWIERCPVNRATFDFSWRPNPSSPPYIYVWGNKWIPGELQATLEYHVPGATERKYVSDLIEVLPQLDRWNEVQPIDKSSLDMTWRPDPREPPYIYVWGNKWISGELQATLEYTCPEATDRKYMEDLVEVLPEMERWKERQEIDRTSFDLSWRPDPREPPYIYVWGNKWIPGELQATLEYMCPGATERKYMADLVEVLPEVDRWNEVQPIDKSSLDMSWRPDPREPPYIYVWGNKWVSGELLPTLEYICPGATERKYMADLVEVLPEVDRWNEVQPIERASFDLSWRPDPREPPYIYVWGNKWIPGELQATLEYMCPGATERKYMEDLIEVLPETERWKERQLIDLNSCDLTWRPDPREPPYIYVWGNKWIPGELQSTLEYICPGAIERKYMEDLIEVLPEKDRWNEVQPIDKSSLDMSWRPDPREPPYIYVWGNKWISGELLPTLEYICPGATDRKYMEDLVEVLPEMERWKERQLIDLNSFDLTWRPDPREPPYIYVWGNKWIPGELQATLEYICPEATERKYMPDLVEVLSEVDRWNEVQPIDKSSLDLSWRPDPREPPYIYVWGNKWVSGELLPTLEYTCPGATERKYMPDPIEVLPEMERWKERQLIDKTSFDLSWRPDPREPPYIYVWGNKWIPGELQATLEYTCPGATERKYMADLVEVLPELDRWVEVQPIDRTSFDLTWRPDPREPPYIYVWGNKWISGELQATLEYTCPGATERKYMPAPIKVLPELGRWTSIKTSDLTFDLSWRPNPTNPPQVYQWPNDGPRYTVPGATETDIIFMEDTEEFKIAIEAEKKVSTYKIKTNLEALIAEHPNEVFWALNPDMSYIKFDFTWRPEKDKERYINVFGNKYSANDEGRVVIQTYFVNGPAYIVGYKEFNYVEKITSEIKIEADLNMFWVDRGNPESTARFENLRSRLPRLQKTRFLNSWVDTISRCVNKSETTLFWVLNSELDYTDFNFDFYPGAWQAKMVHVFGTQWTHWGNTYMINRDTFADETKYVKIVEHLNILNFVKTKKARATNCLYDVVLIDHGNSDTKTVDRIKSKINDRSIVATVPYEDSYLKTLTNMLPLLPVKKDHHIWVCSSVCDYSKFDFTYICDPFAKEQLHVFPSDKQKFGDTFLVDVNKLRELIGEMTLLEDYKKINYNEHLRAKRLPAPIITVDSDTHCGSITDDFKFPYAVFETEEISCTDHEPMNLWTPETKTLMVTTTGGTRIVVPREAKAYIKKELYDYPYIKKSTTLVKSAPLDIVFLSNGETGADENYEYLQKVVDGLENRIVRVDGVKGRVASYHAAAAASQTPWMFTVFAKLKVSQKFDWNWQPDRLQIPKHYIFQATNPVNGLVYGHQAMIAYNKKLVLGNTGHGLDFTLDDEHEVVELNSGVANFNTDAWSTWRTSFREVLKLKAANTTDSAERLKAWSTIAKGDFAKYSLDGARHAAEYYDEVDGDIFELRLSYDWAWLKERFVKVYPDA